MQKDFRTILGVLLILAGVLLSLQRLEIIGGQWDNAVLTLLYGLGVVYFATMFFANRTRWWAALGTFLLLGFALGQLSEIFLPESISSYVGSLVLFMMAIGFLSVFLLNRTMWWAIIPSGVMFSLTAVTLFDKLPFNFGFYIEGVLFIGLGLTFLVLYFLRVNGQQLGWAIFPAIPLLVLGLVVGFKEHAAWGYIWPAVIILLGVYFVFGALRRKD